jgi:hypothetical protein
MEVKTLKILTSVSFMFWSLYSQGKNPLALTNIDQQAR